MSEKLQRYSDFRPTAFDTQGLGLEDRQEWLLAPVMRTRDSGPLAESNFETALKTLGGESETVEIHRFGHWGPGWIEIILIDPSDKIRLCLAIDIAESLEDYPILDETDFSEREWEEYLESWNSWGRRDFIKVLSRKFDKPVLEDLLDDADEGDLLNFYESLTNWNYQVSDEGVYLNIKGAVEACHSTDLKEFLKQQHNRSKQEN